MSDQPNDIIFSVPFVMDEKDNEVRFNSKDEKKEYIKKEKHFCLNEYEKYAGTFDVQKRKLVKIDLEKKRMAFAIHSGFHQVANTGVWNRVVRNDAPIVA